MTDQGGEGILEEIGGFGTYQKLLCVLVVGAVNGVSAMSFAAQLFSLLTPEHWCWDPKLASLEEQLPLSQEQGKKFSLPVESTRLLPWTESEISAFSKCRRYDGDLVGAYLGWMNAKRPPHYVPKTPVLGRPYPLRDCPEGWTYNHSFATLITENDWVCDSKWKTHIVHGAFWLGVAIGGIVSRHLANRYGKRTALISGMVLQVIGGCIALISSDLIPLFVSRLSLGMGQFTSSYLSLQLVIELCAEKYRVLPVVALMVAHITGTLAVPWVAHGWGSWWWLTLTTTILSATLGFVLLWVLGGVVYYGNYYTTVGTCLDRSSIPTDVFLSFWYAALMEIPTWMLPLILQGRPFLQKIILGLAFSTAAMSGINQALLPTGYAELTLVLGLVTRLAVTIAYYSALQRWSENNVFGTGTATSMETSFGIAALIIPCSLYVGQFYSRIPVFVFAIVALFAAVVSLFLPIKTAEDQPRKTQMLYRIRHWLQTKSIRRISIVSQKTEENPRLTISTVTYNPLESS